MTQENKPTRRDFLVGTAAVVGAAAVATPTPAQAAAPASARIVQIEHSKAHLGKTKLDEPVVKTMIHEALKAYTGAATAVEALGKYFDPKQNIAIKVNTLGSPYSAVNPEVAHELADLFQQLGSPKNKLRIFDQYQTRMRKGRYRLRRSDSHVWVHKHLGRHGKKIVYTDPTYEKHTVEFHWDESIVWADAVLNLCIPKDHDLTGVTGALKNMAFGVIEPTAERSANKANPGHYTVVPRFHRNNADPAIAWLYSQPMIKGKVKLIMADALRVLYHGGPQDKPRYRLVHNQIWVTEDPVACDTTILNLVNGMRKDKGMVPVEEALFRGKPRPPRYLKSCVKYGLGVGDASKITLDKKVIG
ncbi:MAG: hypothetical protein ACI9WU_001816 [Myxococcota bacterium]|jgi:hypothetical protein